MGGCRLDGSSFACFGWGWSSLGALRLRLRRVAFIRSLRLALLKRESPRVLCEGRRCRVVPRCSGRYPWIAVCVGLQPALKRLRLTDVGAGRCRGVCRSDCYQGRGCRVGSPCRTRFPWIARCAFRCVVSRLQDGALETTNSPKGAESGSWHGGRRGRAAAIEPPAHLGESQAAKRRSNLARPVEGLTYFAGGVGGGTFNSEPRAESRPEGDGWTEGNVLAFNVQRCWVGGGTFNL